MSGAVGQHQFSTGSIMCLMMHFCGTLHCTVLLLLLHFTTMLLYVHDVGNCNIGKSAAKESGEYQRTSSDWRVITMKIVC